MAIRPSLPPLQSSDFTSAFPNSRKVHSEVGELRVPMREIALSGGEPPLRVYDTSGPQGHDVRDGLPELRQPWIDARDGISIGPRSIPVTSTLNPPMSASLLPRTQQARRGSDAVTQLRYARRGIIT